VPSRLFSQALRHLSQGPQRISNPKTVFTPKPFAPDGTFAPTPRLQS
jgi:hypothetical protein